MYIYIIRDEAFFLLYLFFSFLLFSPKTKRVLHFLSILLMKIAPILKTERLLLRPIEIEDAPSVYRWTHSEEVTKYLFYLPNLTLEDTERLVSKWVKKRRNYEWVLLEGEDVFGEIQVIKDLPQDGFEIGYESREDRWGNGYVKEGLIAVFHFLFEEAGYSYGYAITRKENERSKGLLRHLGFKVIGETTRHIDKTGEDLPLLELRLEKEDFENSISKEKEKS